MMSPCSMQPSPPTGHLWSVGPSLYLTGTSVSKTPVSGAVSSMGESVPPTLPNMYASYSLTTNIVTGPPSSSDMMSRCVAEIS